MTSKINRIAVIGTGIMGAPMAGRLADAGFQVQVWNRTPEKAAVLQSKGISIVERPNAAAKDAIAAMQALCCNSPPLSSIRILRD